MAFLPTNSVLVHVKICWELKEKNLSLVNRTTKSCGYASQEKLQPPKGTVYKTYQTREIKTTKHGEFPKIVLFFNPVMVTCQCLCAKLQSQWLSPFLKFICLPKVSNCSSVTTPELYLKLLPFAKTFLFFFFFNLAALLGSFLFTKSKHW